MNGYTYRSTVATVDGRYMIGVSSQHRAASGLAAGDEVDVELVLDTEPRTVELPADFAAALDAEPAARATFDKLSNSNKGYHVSLDRRREVRRDTAAADREVRRDAPRGPATLAGGPSLAFEAAARERFERSFGMYRDLVASLADGALTSRLGGLRSNTIGAQLWCVVGARESYSRAIEAGGAWSGFSCSLDDTADAAKVAAALASSENAVRAALDGMHAADAAPWGMVLDLLEHEAAHHGQLDPVPVRPRPADPRELEAHVRPRLTRVRRGVQERLAPTLRQR